LQGKFAIEDFLKSLAAAIMQMLVLKAISGGIGGFGGITSDEEVPYEGVGDNLAKMNLYSPSSPRIIVIDANMNLKADGKDFVSNFRKIEKVVDRYRV